MSELQLCALKALIAYQIHKKWKKRQRSMYIRPIFFRRNLLGESLLADELKLDPFYHNKYFRMSKENFQHILNLVKEEIWHPMTHERPITPVERLSITLRFLATGNSQLSIALNYRVSPSSVSNILRETMSAICQVLEPDYLQAPTRNTWIQNEEAFKQMWNFDNGCGSIDGKHIRCRKPLRSGSEYYNYKNYFSIVLLAIANVNYEFTCVDIGSVGSESDGGILIRSALGRRLQSVTLGIPKQKALPNGSPVPHIIVGDDAFPLKSFLMKPYPGKWLDMESRVFNYRVSRARLVVENAFGILAARWRIFHTPIACDTSLLILITKTTVILHNYLRRRADDQITPDTHKNNEIIEGSWRAMVQGDTGMQNLPKQGSNNFSYDAEVVRTTFKNYFNSEAGKVDWQYAHVNKGL